ncbi:MAG: hypothetical protein AAGJ31_07145 [Verrucomicrobiota bacterium]
MSTVVEKEQSLGDQVWDLAMTYASRVNAGAHATTCRDQTQSKERYFGYITAMYPIVVGFNRCLIRSMAKIDHVRNTKMIRYLADQLKEEQGHNSLWRTMMETYELDHEKLYSNLENYLAQFTNEQLNEMTANYVKAAREDVSNVSPGAFPNPVVPEPVLALYHLLYQSSTDPDIHYWVHFTSQSVVEFIIFEVVSESVYPGIKGREDLDFGPRTLTWWKEHARQGSENGKRSDEEKHLEMAKIALNRSEEAQGMADQIIERAEDAMRLFAGTAFCNDPDKAAFDVTPYLKSA